MAFLDILFFAGIAIFLGYRLWGLLGTHDPERPVQKRSSENEDRVIPIRSQLRPRVRVAAHKKQVEKDDTQEHFLKGAAIAFRKIVEAYAKEDIPLLRKLLEGPLLETFEDAIEKRKQAKKSLEVDLDRITKTEVLDSWEEKETAYITVRFVSQQCLVTRDKRGKILSGDPDQYTEITDIWTFSRPLRSRDPNWKLVATQLPTD